jgi:hypothetical protein
VAAGPLSVAASIVVLRGHHLAKQVFGKVGFACPGCHKRGKPIFVCRCGHEVPDLHPSVFGVLFTACPACGELLRTADLFGRLEQLSKCRYCKRELPAGASGFGKLPEFKVGVVGPKRSSKSTFVIASLWHLKTFALRNRLSVTFPDRAQEAYFHRQVEKLKAGIALEKTQHEEVPPQIMVRLTDSGGWAALLSLVDAAGEDYEELASLRNHPFEQYDALIILVDPFAEPTVQQGELGPVSPEVMRQAAPSDVAPSEVIGVVLSRLEQLGLAPGQRIGMPVAVVVTKADLPPVADRCPPLRAGWERRRFENIGAAAAEAEDADGKLQDLLRAMGLGNLVNGLRSRFDRAYFFAASPLGRPAFPARDAPFMPAGVLPPLVWLAYHVKALEEVDAVDLSIIQLYQFWRRSLRGEEGPGFTGLAWGCPLVLLAALLLLAVVLPRMLVGIFGLIFALVVLLCLYLVWVLVYREDRRGP